MKSDDQKYTWMFKTAFKTIFKRRKAFASNQRTPQVQIIVILLLPRAFFIATKLGRNICVANTGHLRESAVLFYIISFIATN